MRRFYTIGIVVFVLALAQVACNLPVAASEASISPTPTITLPPVYTATAPAAATATLAPTATAQPLPTQPPLPTATARPSACSYVVSFLGDVTIPDDSVLEPGAVFNKIWRVRNDGTCTWGSGYSLHSLDYVSGSSLSSANSVSLPASVAPGQTVDLSVGMAAPASPGVYTSNWMFHVVNDPIGRGPYIGLGAGADSPLYVRIKVANPGPVVKRVSFAAGATQAIISDTLAANETRGYIVSAMQNQVLIAGVSSASGQVKTKITAANGAALGSESNRGTSDASALLPSTQDYTVWITAGAQSTSFSLNIVIPARITFDAGSTSAAVTGKTVTKLMVHYVIRAQSGQLMKVNLTGDAGLTIYGYSGGEVLARSAVGDGNWSGTLPATQDYILIVEPRADSVNYTLKVTVTNSAYP